MIGKRETAKRPKRMLAFLRLLPASGDADMRHNERKRDASLELFLITWECSSREPWVLFIACLFGYSGECLLSSIWVCQTSSAQSVRPVPRATRPYPGGIDHTHEGLCSSMPRITVSLRASSQQYTQRLLPRGIRMAVLVRLTLHFRCLRRDPDMEFFQQE